ncbi:hypothetical protein BH11PSE3_BH11PSE3_03860 [soil metagenome]
MWSGHPHLVQKAIAKVEQAWALTRDPRIAIQLATMYDRANRNDDGLVVLRWAFHDNPRHALLRHHAGITLLRHGTPADIRDFFDSVLAFDPRDAFAQFIVTLLDGFDGRVEQLVSLIERDRDGRQPFLISLPVWGQPFTDYCVRYLCGSLLSPGNVPALAKTHAVHIAVFTDEKTEQILRADPLFCQFAEHAKIHFVRYSADLVNHQPSLDACYGDQKVEYSAHSLAFYYARNCKFALMSCGHYAALAAGRATGALVSSMVADIVLNDGALPEMAAAMVKADALLVHAIQLHGKDVRPLLDREFRQPDGVLRLSSETLTNLVVEQIPEINFADTACFADPPLRIAWRVGDQGVLVHGNHYHPFCLRPTAFEHPLKLSIDPVDSRFIERTSLERDRIHLVQDSSIISLSIDDDPILAPSEHSMGTLSVPLLALWLWGYWGRLRGELFRTPVRFGRVVGAEDWQRAEAAASAMVDAIVEGANALDSDRQATKSWRLPGGRDR